MPNRSLDAAKMTNRSLDAAKVPNPSPELKSAPFFVSTFLLSILINLQGNKINFFFEFLTDFCRNFGKLAQTAEISMSDAKVTLFSRKLRN